MWPFGRKTEPKKHNSRPYTLVLGSLNLGDWNHMVYGDIDHTSPYAGKLGTVWTGNRLMTEGDLYAGR